MNGHSELRSSTVKGSTSSTSSTSNNTTYLSCESRCISSEILTTNCREGIFFGLIPLVVTMVRISCTQKPLYHANEPTASTARHLMGNK